MALLPAAVTVAIYHGVLKGWLTFWMFFNAWISRRNYVSARDSYMLGEGWQRWVVPYGLSIMCASGAVLNFATLLL